MITDAVKLGVIKRKKIRKVLREIKNNPSPDGQWLDLRDSRSILMNRLRLLLKVRALSKESVMSQYNPVAAQNEPISHAISSCTPIPELTPVQPSSSSPASPGVASAQPSSSQVPE
jgi:hypothetical protein